MPFEVKLQFVKSFVLPILIIEIHCQSILTHLLYKSYQWLIIFALVNYQI